MATLTMVLAHPAQQGNIALGNMLPFVKCVLQVVLSIVSTLVRVPLVIMDPPAHPAPRVKQAIIALAGPIIIRAMQERIIPLPWAVTPLLA